MLCDFVYRLFARFWQGFEDFRVRKLERNLGACGRRASISALCHIASPEMLTLGDDVQINPFTQIFAGGGVWIGSGVLISSNCVITSVTHLKNSTERHLAPAVSDAEKPALRPVRIGRNVWVGAGAIILPGVTIGDHSVIGAGAVVTRDVPEKCVYVGNPARLLERLPI